MKNMKKNNKKFIETDTSFAIEGLRIQKINNTLFVTTSMFQFNFSIKDLGIYTYSYYDDVQYIYLKYKNEPILPKNVIVFGLNLDTYSELYKSRIFAVDKDSLKKIISFLRKIVKDCFFSYDED